MPEFCEVHFKNASFEVERNHCLQAQNPIFIKLVANIINFDYQTEYGRATESQKTRESQLLQSAIGQIIVS
jgi:hypothetical protein